jgi:virginiamycin A acetyltransferase
MNDANHRIDGVSTFPFPIMGEPWSDHFDLIVDLPERGDTVVGHDVWLGYQAIVMPGCISALEPSSRPARSSSMTSPHIR